MIKKFLQSLREYGVKETVRRIRIRLTPPPPTYPQIPENYITECLSGGWVNKGHAFDELGKIFRKNRKLVLVGNQEDLQRVAGRVKFLGCKIRLCEWTPENAVKLLPHKRGITIIVCGDNGTIYNDLILKGWRNNVNIFYEYVFFALNGFDYLPIFALYTKNMVVARAQCAVVTEYCNLKCKYCGNFCQYVSKPRHVDFEIFTRSIDAFFSKIDYCLHFEFAGGETLLYPRLAELIVYAGEKYRKKMEIFNVVTNATLPPSDELCEVCAKYNVTLNVSDYSPTIPELRQKIEIFIEKANSYNIRVVRQSAPFFVCIFPPAKENVTDDIQVLKKRYINCVSNGLKGLWDGRSYSCQFLLYASNTGLVPPPDSSEYLDLRHKLSKHEIVEFRAGFNDKGYVSFCKYCNGFNIHDYINPHTSPVAEQAKGILSWDINSPIFLEDME